jgi:small subunit ribosomal protein S1
MPPAPAVLDQRVNDVRDFLKVDEEVEARILGPDRKGRMVSLSLKEPSQGGSQKEAEGASSAPPSATLGDILKEKMGGSKSDS